MQLRTLPKYKNLIKHINYKDASLKPSTIPENSYKFLRRICNASILNTV